MSYEMEVLSMKETLEKSRTLLKDAEKLEAVLKSGIDISNYYLVLTFLDIQNENWDGKFSSLVYRQHRIEYMSQKLREQCQQMLSQKPASSDWAYESVCKKHGLPNNYMTDSALEINKNLSSYQEKLSAIEKQLIEFLPTLNSGIPKWWPISLPLFEENEINVEDFENSYVKDFFSQYLTPSYVKSKFIFRKSPLGATETSRSVAQRETEKELATFFSLYRDFIIYQNP